MIKEFDFKKYMSLAAGLVMAASLILAPLVYAQGPPEDVAARVAERRAEAQERIENRRQNGQERSQAARQQACERRLDAMNNVTDRVAEKALRHVGVFDAIFERVQGFYESGQLTDPNYDELETAVVEAQAAAQTEAEALSELNVEIDCEDPDVAAVVGAFRDSADMARLALHDYRAALVTLISSLRAEAAEANAQNDDSSEETESESESETEDETEVENESEDENEQENETES